jgi:MFS family permease
MTKRMYTEYARNRAVQLISILGFTFGVSIAILAYIASSYFREVVQSDNVSSFYIVAFFVILGFLFKLNRIIENVGRAKTLMILLVVQIFVLFLLQFFGVSWLGAFFLMAYYVLYSIIWVVFDVILEAYSEDAKTGQIRGAYLSVWNFGFLIGPLFSMYLLENYGFYAVFFVSMLLYVFLFFIVFVALNDIKGHVEKKNYSTKKIFSQFRKNTALVHIYLISFTLRFFYAVMTIYMPLYLRSIGLTWGDIGIIFSIMLIPFIIIQYPAGVLADKKYGEKEMLFIGFVIIACSLIVMYISKSGSFALWATILFISRIGAALVEVMLDSYFYKQINEKDIAIINFFRTTRAIAYITSALIIGFVLMFFEDFRSIFIILFISVCLGLIPVFIMKDTVPQK